MTGFSLLTILVPHGHARKIVHEGRKLGLHGATILLAQGTVKSKLLDFLGINQTEKEVILSIGEHTQLTHIMEELNRLHKVTRKNFGIAFIIPITYANKQTENSQPDTQKEIHAMRSAIFTIVDRWRANEVVDATVAAGARGGTILHARGSGANQAKLIFDMEIEPEKEIVLTIVESAQVDPVVTAIRQHSDVEKDGHGILFVLPITESYGIK